MADAYPSDFVGNAAPLAPGDLRAAAAVLGVSVAKVAAVKDVESRGRGFHPDTRRPIILFEPHVFHRETGGKFAAIAPDLSYEKWGEQPYPPSQTIRFDQLRRAMALDTTAALRSASWGLFQIMGYNSAPAGFATLPAFVDGMCESEGTQLVAFANYVKAYPKLLNALKMSDWSGFARIYNGPGYAQHGYDQRLKAAFASYRDGGLPASAGAQA